jgi:2-deoxy-D-gluconate 3-dehydrogenase
MSDPFRLDAKVALVTGENTGIGQAIAIAIGLARAGAEVIAAGRSSLDATLGLLAAEGLNGRPFTLALDEPAASAQSLSTVGPLDILVNNAGIIRRADAVDFSEADWDDVIDVNLKAVFFLSQAFARAAFARGAGGAIVNIASLLAFQGGIRIPSYTAAKHGVAGLTKLLANEWAGRGINVNAVAPRYIETNNTDALRADAARNKAILDRIPAGRWGEPEDVAGAAVFLASPAASYVNGTILPVDGAWLAR